MHNQKKNGSAVRWSLFSFVVPDFLTAAWIGAVFSGLVLASGIVAGTYLLIPSVLFLASIAAAVYYEQLIGPGETTVALYAEQRSSKKIGAPALHSSVAQTRKTGTANPSRLLLASLSVLYLQLFWVAVNTLSRPGIVTVFALGLPALFLGWGYAAERKSAIWCGLILTAVVLVLGRDTPFLLLYGAGFITAAMITAWYRGKLQEVALVAVLGYMILASQALYFAGGFVTKGAVVVLSLFLILATTAPFALMRRNMAHKHSVRVVFGAASLYVVLLPFLIGPGFDYASWLSSLAICSFAAAGYGAIAWWRHGRYSYAHYFGVSILAGVLAVAVFIPGSLTVQMALICSSLVVFLIGLVLPSYTARTAGIGMLMAASAYYAVTIFPYDIVVRYAEFDSSVRLVTGILLIASVKVAALGYASVEMKALERKHSQSVIQMLYLIGICVAAGLTRVISTPSAAQALWILLGLATAVWGSSRRLPLISSAGAFLVTAGLLLTAFNDLPAQGSHDRTVALSVAAAAVAIISLIPITYLVKRKTNE